MYNALADAVLLLHLAVVIFVLGGLVAIVAGHLASWRWVNSFCFRATHLGAIGVVVVQAWLGQTCPLTTLESWLRGRAGGTGYRAGFIEHWVQSLLFYEAPTWVFTAVYSAFALLVLASWRYLPPRRTGRADAAVAQDPERTAGHENSKPPRRPVDHA